MLVLNKIHEPNEEDLDPSYKQFLDDHVDYILASQYFTVQTLTGRQTLKYIGDFEGLLLELMIPRSMFYLTLRCNRLTSSAAWTGEATTVIIPSESESKLLRNIYLTKSTT